MRGLRVNKFGSDICQALSFFMPSVDAAHYLVFMLGKVYFLEIMVVFSKATELTYTSIELGNKPLSISDENVKLLELFILRVFFGKDHRYTNINKARRTLFFRSPNPKLKNTVYQKILYLST